MHTKITIMFIKKITAGKPKKSLRHRALFRLIYPPFTKKKSPKLPIPNIRYANQDAGRGFISGEKDTRLRLWRGLRRSSVFGCFGVPSRSNDPARQVAGQAAKTGQSATSHYPDRRRLN
ncbi:MAG: hypothetical protein D6714_05405 [Bacteroidetes bacterium]|nr:MAG: hypothetical protein D6714_05405 [Bacteroidota bacterium]